MFCPQGQNSGFSRHVGSNFKVRTKESHSKYGDSQIRHHAKVTVPDGSPPIPKARLEIQQEDKVLVLLTLKTRKIIWMHPDHAQDKQWDSKKFKSKGKSCNVVSILPDDDNITIASLSDSENKKHTFTAQADAL